MVYTARTVEDLAAFIKDAQTPLVIAGGGTRGVVDQPTISMTGFAGVVDYEPGALTLVVRAGTPLREVEAVLAKEGQRLPFEPARYNRLLGRGGESTIGGVVAANISGPRRVQAGACRDSLIGVQFVDGQGRLLKNGGRVMKNVTGYDLVKLLAGSYGTLGVLTEVSFKVLPGVETEATLAVDAKTVAEAVGVMSCALKTPYEVSGAAYDPKQGRVFLRLEGFASSVKYRSEMITKTVGGEVEIISDPKASGEIWNAVRDVEPLAGGQGDLWRISVKPSDAPELQIEGECLYDWGGGLIWARVESGTDIRAQLNGIEGHATCLEGAFARFHPQPAPLRALQDGLRRKFDPRGIFNPDVKI